MKAAAKGISLKKCPIGTIVQEHPGDGTQLEVLCHYPASLLTPEETLLKPVGHYNRFRLQSGTIVYKC